MEEKKTKYFDILNPVPRSSGEKTDFYRIGTLFQHGEKFTGELFATPINGQLVVMPPFPKKERSS